ncbi:hypothetical protein BX661DRAFT_84664 [Kickxella alabastrina]|uniref:uncharacterized protein n=1 Tax=Kickxella alabastrina TaxID=61397 RepID=UPI0022211927|nr:uncharacterized protein BX661DRAFT_84664 [Kickxella alabastrina]KAI7819563.1 hypothetical protein BX661DRAFT_84664 [Kickxella alabastrina]
MGWNEWMDFWVVVACKTNRKCISRFLVFSFLFTLQTLFLTLFFFLSFTFQPFILLPFLTFSSSTFFKFIRV